LLVEISKRAPLSSAELTAYIYAAFQTPETLDGRVFHLASGEKSIVFVISITNFDAKAVENLLTAQALA